jgi:hypothetical protein
MRNSKYDTFINNAIVEGGVLKGLKNGIYGEVHISPDVWRIEDIRIFSPKDTDEKNGGPKRLAISKLFIHKDIDSINPLALSEADIAECVADGDNEAFCSYDGVVYNKAKTKLLAYPFGKRDKVYNIPNTVEIIGSYAVNNPFLERVNANSVKKIEYKGLNCQSVSKIVMPNCGIFGYDEESHLESVRLNEKCVIYTKERKALFKDYYGWWRHFVKRYKIVWHCGDAKIAKIMRD